ncbi:hypothetical protein BDF21DRAFT_397196 [Thamnidium elegans]|nr:hypothetical protein BDF21DRAFT_397196 [Thamnidium elegans]
MSAQKLNDPNILFVPSLSDLSTKAYSTEPCLIVLPVLERHLVFLQKIIQHYYKYFYCRQMTYKGFPLLSLNLTSSTDNYVCGCLRMREMPRICVKVLDCLVLVAVSVTRFLVYDFLVYGYPVFG